MKRLHWSKLVSLLVGLSLALNSILSGGAAALAGKQPPPADGCNANNIIVNGSFEEPVVQNPANWDIFGPEHIDGWSAHWRSDVPENWQGAHRPAPQIELQRGYADWLPQDGAQLAELDTDWDGPSGSLNGEPASIVLEQHVKKMVVGAKYELKFWTSPRPGVGSADNITQVTWGDEILDTITEDGSANQNTVWTEHTYTVTATSAAMKLIFTDLGAANSLGGFLDQVSLERICEPEPDPCNFGDQTGWYGEYFNYSSQHPDMELPGDQWNKNYGDPMGANAPWTTDWYTQHYFRFWRVDPSLTFGENFFPFDPPKDEEIQNGHEYDFGVHWTSQVTAPADGDYAFTLKSDDDAWLYLDGVLIADNSGVHPPKTLNGTMALTTTPKILDIYFAERHVVESHMYFSFVGDIFPQIVPYNRACPQPVPQLSLEKTGEYEDPTTDQVNYTINWNLTGHGTLNNLTITDELPTGTSFVSADNGGTLGGTTVTWNLGSKTAPDSGAVHMVVSLNSAEPWADHVVSYNPGTQKSGASLPAERTDTTQALGPDTDTDNAPINFVTLGFGGSLVLGFDNFIMDRPGADIHVIETSWGNPSASSYPEKVEVLASQYGTDWVSLGTQTRSEVNHDNDFNLSDGSLLWARYLKLVDKTDINWPGWDGAADGYDVAGVQAIHSGPSECTLNNGAHITGLAYNQQPVGADATTTTNINQVACLPHNNNVTIVAHKIVCDNEADLPNWGPGGPDITADTAQNWVNSHQSCHFVSGWGFQWGPQNAYDPGDTLIGPANAPWQMMPPTDANGMTTTTLTAGDIADSSYLWFREVLQEGYIPFTYDQNGDTNVDPVSAELYCHVDVLNYDNYDRIDGVELGKTYNCVGFNSPSTIPVSYTISGMKFDDHNGNGIKDQGEVGLKDWTIYASQLFDEVNVDSHGEVTGTPIQSNKILEAGKEYVIRVSGTFDAGDSITADAKYSVRTPNTEWTDIVQNYEGWGPKLLDLFVNLLDPAIYDSPNWGSYNSGHVYWKTFNGTGDKFTFQIYDIFASNDVGKLNVKIYQVLAETTTDKDGNYNLVLPNGTTGNVVVSEGTQDGWLQTLPADSSYYTVPSDESSVDKDFGNHQPGQDGDNGGQQELTGSISGIKFNDHNGDGAKDVNDGPLADWTIYIDANKDGDLDIGEPTYFTGEDGAYVFSGLGVGTYEVREVGNNGWTQTYPASGYHSLVLGDGTWIWAGINFGNHEGSVQGQGEEGSGGGGGNGGGIIDNGGSGGTGGQEGGGPALTNPTGGTGNSNQEVAGETEENTGTGGTGGGRHLALGAGTGDEGNLQDQGNVAGDQITNDQNNNGQTSSGWGSGWKVFGIIAISLLLLLLIIYGIYKWMNRKGKPAGGGTM